MKQLFFVFAMILSISGVAQAQTATFNRGDIDFSGPAGVWVNTSAGDSLGYMIVRNRENSFRIDVFADGGRFLVRSYCQESRRGLKNILTVVIPTDGSAGFMRDCDSTHVAIPRHNALRVLVRLIPDSAAPPQIDIYLVQLLAEYSALENR